MKELKIPFLKEHISCKKFSTTNPNSNEMGSLIREEEDKAIFCLLKEYIQVRDYSKVNYIANSIENPKIDLLLANVRVDWKKYQSETREKNSAEDSRLYGDDLYSSEGKDLNESS